MAIQENNIKVPEEIAVVGFDDIYMSNFFTPSLTTIRVPRKEWGTTAAQTLFEMLDHNYDYEPGQVKVELMSRTSS